MNIAREKLPTVRNKYTKAYAEAVLRGREILKEQKGKDRKKGIISLIKQKFSSRSN